MNKNTARKLFHQHYVTQAEVDDRACDGVASASLDAMKNAFQRGSLSSDVLVYKSDDIIQCALRKLNSMDGVAATLTNEILKSIEIKYTP